MPTNCDIITDSPCDLTKEYLDANNVPYLSFTYTERDKEDGGFCGTDDLFQSRTPKEFYDAIRNGACPITSQPSPGAFEACFRNIIESGRPTVYLCFTSGLSGCYDGAVMAHNLLREEYGDAADCLHIVDLKIGSTPETLLVVEAIRLRDLGFTAEQMVAWAENARYHTQTIFTLENLDALARGGRIPPAAAKIASVLDVKPILSFNLEGELTILGVARGRKKSIKKMVDYYKKNHDASVINDLNAMGDAISQLLANTSPEECTQVVALGNADCREDLDILMDLLKKADGDARFVTTTIGPTIGCHVGPGMISCCFWGPDRRSGKVDTGKRN